MDKNIIKQMNKDLKKIIRDGIKRFKLEEGDKRSFRLLLQMAYIKGNMAVNEKIKLTIKEDSIAMNKEGEKFRILPPDEAISLIDKMINDAKNE